MTFVFAELTIVAAWFALETSVIAIHRTASPVVSAAAWGALHFCFLWFFCFVVIGINRLALQAVDNGVPTFSAIFRQPGRGQNYLLASLAYWIAVLIGLCLLIIPGIVLAVRWSLFRLVLADTPSTAFSALRSAATLATCHRKSLFRILALSAALNLAGAALLGVGLLATFPITVIFRARYFRTLRGIDTNQHLPTEAT